MSENGSEFTTTVGRIVFGHPGETRDKKKDGQPVLDQTTQQPIKQTVFGVAFPKAEFDQHIKPWLEYEAGTTFSNGIPPQFAWKYVDGDRADAPWNQQRNQAGTPYNQRPGYAGHYVLTFSTELPGMPQMFVLNNGAYFQIGKDQIKCGDYVRIKVNAKAHGGNSPGLYVNPMLLEKVGDGEAIQTGGGAGDPMAAFGGQAAQLPPGVSAPTVGQPPAAPAPQTPQQPAYAPPAPQAPAPAPGNPPQAPAPAPGNPPQAHAAPAAAPGYTAAPPPASPSSAPPAPQMPPPATDFIPGAPQAPQPPAAPYPGMPAPR